VFKEIIYIYIKDSLCIEISTQDIQAVCPFVMGGCFLNFVV